MRDAVDRILDAARSILSEEGAGAFNTNRIAQMARVSVGSLYEYFPDKDAIIDRISEEMATKETEEVLDLLRKKSGGSPTEVVESDRVSPAAALRGPPAEGEGIG